MNKNKLPERIRWTLMHEIGHIVLGHLSDFEIKKTLNFQTFCILLENIDFHDPKAF
ncbi:MAG: ImmA/IrrE family metallo-endopeptidase [Syntrophomonadaceae bacterium]|nr:ImmA/IrrE family metallo-endopeptidase [Syntrophomonadaceae bacterium]